MKNRLYRGKKARACRRVPRVGQLRPSQWDVPHESMCDPRFSTWGICACIHAPPPPYLSLSLSLSLYTPVARAKFRLRKIIYEYIYIYIVGPLHPRYEERRFLAERKVYLFFSLFPLLQRWFRGWIGRWHRSGNFL